VGQPLRAFGGYGIELEYAIVDAISLDPRPLAPKLLRALDSGHAKSLAGTAIDWSNELVQHVVEMKNVHPAPSLTVLEPAFRAGIECARRCASRFGAVLMPTAMHPWMNSRKSEMWTDQGTDIYRAFDRIFDCRRHGWANLQSMHINLPFAGDAEFARLHAAVRAVLPLIPALAASSPIADAKRAPFLDYRLEVYRTNAERVPSITGAVIPDNANGRADYERNVLAPMYRDIAVHDSGRVLQHEWLNARGAIARFDRNAIEIRVCDTQECPRADLAIAALVVAVVRALCDERWRPLGDQQALPTPQLATLLRDTIRDGDEVTIVDRGYLRIFGIDDTGVRAADVWAHLVQQCDRDASALNARYRDPIEMITAAGSLARRILRAIDGPPSRSTLEPIYRRLCDCLARDELFVAS
jgi:carboxylate-amine ligase